MTFYLENDNNIGYMEYINQEGYFFCILFGHFFSFFWLALASGFWLLAFGFWLWLLALASGFGFFWLWASSGFETLASAAFGLTAILHDSSSLFA